jgi:hypothetical protein
MGIRQSSIGPNWAATNAGNSSFASLSKALVLFAFLAAITAVPALGSTQQSIPLNGGTLSWIATYSTGHCNNGANTYGQYSLANFVYSYTYPSTYHPGENIPVAVSLGGTASYISNSIGQPYCPPNGPIPANGLPLVDIGSFYRVWFTPGQGGTGTATMESFSLGGVAPKYVVIGVIYAPPNPGPTSAFGPSYVNYTGTTQAGTNSTLSSSFQNESSYSTSGSFLGVTLSGGADWSQTTDDSTSISVNKTISASLAYPGTVPATGVGLNHDDDVIALWINPALLCTAEETWNLLPIPAAAQCVIYDPEGLPGDPDDPAMDVQKIPLGELNGDYSLQLLNSDIYNILQSHNITPADYPTIVSADPYVTCRDSINCVKNVIGVNLTRFDRQDQAPIIDFGNGCIKTDYSVSYQTTTTEGQDASQSFAVTNTLSGSESFLGTMNEILKSTQTWTNKWSETTTSMTGQTAELVVNEPCSGYTGPSQFAVYKDNIYGTFMLFPTQ